MSLEVTGVIKKFLPLEGGETKEGKDGNHNLTLLLTMMDYDPEAEQLFCFDVFGKEKIEQLNSFNKIGDNVKVSFNIRTNEWKEKYYTSLASWRIEKVEGGSVEPVEEAKDDLPF